MLQTTLEKPYVNKYLSVSRIGRFESCRLSFKLAYADKLIFRMGKLVPKEIAGNEFGSFVHAVLELIYQWVVYEEHEGKIPDELIVEKGQHAWDEVPHTLTGVEVFAEAMRMVKEFIASEGPVDHSQIVSIEQEFLIDLGRFKVKGFIDRIDRDPKVEGGIIVRDYKTNRWLFSREETDNALQLSAYGIAVKKLYPWATSVTYAFDMLRHRVQLTTTRTDEELDVAEAYIIAMGEKMESIVDFQPNLNPMCGWCDYREHCQSYLDMINNSTEFATLSSDDGLELIVAERQKAAATESAGRKRKKDLDKLIVEQFKARDLDEIEIEGSKVKLARTRTTSYSDQTPAIVAKALKIPEAEASAMICSVSSKKLKDLLSSDLDISSGERAMLRATIEGRSVVSMGDPWISVGKSDKEKREAKQAADAAKHEQNRLDRDLVSEARKHRAELTKRQITSIDKMNEKLWASPTAKLTKAQRDRLNTLLDNRGDD